MKAGTNTGGMCFPQHLPQQVVTSTCHQMSRDPKLAHPREVLHLPPRFSVYGIKYTKYFPKIQRLLRVLVPLTEYDY